MSLIIPKEFREKLKSEIREEILEELGAKQAKLDSSNMDSVLSKAQEMINSQRQKFDSEGIAARLLNQVVLSEEQKQLAFNKDKILTTEVRTDLINDTLDQIKIPKDGQNGINGKNGEKGKNGKNYTLKDQDKLDIAENVEMKGFVKEDLFTARYLQLIKDIQSGKIRLPAHGGASGPEVARKIESGGLNLGQASSVNSNDVNEAPIFTLANTAGDVSIFRVDESPEGIVTASRGDLALGISDLEGALWVKHTGDNTNTGWKPFTIVHFADMHLHNNAILTVINTANVPHLVQGLFSIEFNDGFTFAAGSTGTITNTADNGGGLLRVTTGAAHGMVTGTILNTSGLATLAQNNITRITVIDTVTFDCDDISFVTGAETGFYYEGDKLTVNQGSAGFYKVEFHSFGFSPGVNKIFEFEVFKNITAQENVEAKRKYAGSDLGTIGGGGIMELAEGDMVTFAVIGVTDTTNFTMEHTNIVIHSL